MAADLKPPIPPPAPKLTKQNFFPHDEFPPPPQELMETEETDFVPKTEAIFQTNFSRLKTNLIDKKKNIAEVIPQSKEKIEDEEDLFKERGLPVELSDALKQSFPDVKDHVNPEDIEIAAPMIEFDELSEILTDTSRGRLPPQLDFFTGGHNEKCSSRAKNIGLSSNSSNFLDYLGSTRCEDLMISNKLKIHIDSGNIHYDNNDTNESVYDFFQLQGDETKKFIEYEFVYDDTYQQYYDEFLFKINQQDGDRLDVLTNKNSKFLFYHFNDFLTRVNVTPLPVRHSKTTNDDLAIDIIQNENWQYFFERISEACESNRIGDNIDQSNVQESKIIRRSIKNLTMCKEVYREYDNHVAQYFAAMLKTLPSNELEKIRVDLEAHYYFLDFERNVNNKEYLNVLCEFYHRNSRFLGSQNLIIIPTPRIPSFIRADKMISPTRLFERFQFTDARGLVSIQALAALSVYLEGNENTDVATEALTEFLHDMSHQALNVENDNFLLKFTELHLLMDELYRRRSSVSYIQ